jgi:hypothetical protein
MKRKIFLFVIFLLQSSIFAQIESPNLIFNRGKLWQTLGYGKVGPIFSDWSKRGIGLDWPGFDESYIREDIGGSPSYLSTGGFYIGGLLKYPNPEKNNAIDTLVVFEDWSMYAGSIKEGDEAKYKIIKHTHLFKNGENYWLQKNPNMGEEVIESIWLYNTNFTDQYQNPRTMPIKVVRRAHNWSGSQLDENYILYEYYLINISDSLKNIFGGSRFVADTVYDIYIMLNYGLQANSRSWSVLNPSLSPGARNTLIIASEGRAGRRWIYAYADDNPETPINEKFGKYLALGPIVNGNPTGEWLAPGFVGFSLLYASKNKAGQETRVRDCGVSQGLNQADQGPFTGVLGTAEARYEAMKDLTKLNNFVPWNKINDKKSRSWAVMSLGPFDLKPNDTIKIVLCEFVDGLPYEQAINPNLDPAFIANTGIQKIRATRDRADFTFKNGLKHPNPPAAPNFTIDYFQGNKVANVIKWGRETEILKDPFDPNEITGEYLSGYKIYRSNYLPIGPWELIAVIPKGTNIVDSEYVYIDSLVEVGKSYYYALTAYDNGKTFWAANPSVTNVPQMESSIFANRFPIDKKTNKKIFTPFVATLSPKTSLENVMVVPNPFVIGKGFSQPGTGDIIQFVNIPNPCEIRIYTIKGNLVKTIKVEEGVGGIVSWDQVTDFGQFVESGIYIYHIDSPYGKKTGKFAIVR